MTIRKQISLLTIFVFIGFLLPHFSPILGADQQTDNSDIAAVIHESTLNKFLAAIGSVSGKGNTDTPIGKQNYEWTVTNPKVVFKKGVAKFKADTRVKIGIFDYGTVTNGEVEISYNQDKNKIGVTIKRAIFELAVQIFGNKIHITDIDISSFYKPSFEFSGPESFQQVVSVQLPDGTTKDLKLSSGKKTLTIEEGSIVVSSGITFEPQVAPKESQK